MDENIDNVQDKRSLRRKGGPRYDLCYGWRKDKKSEKYKQWIKLKSVSARAFIRKVRVERMKQPPPDS